MQTELARRRAQLTIPAGEFIRHPETDQAPEAVLTVSRPRGGGSNLSQKEVPQQRRRQKVALFQMVKNLRADGAKVIQIMRQAGISHGLANKRLRVDECPQRVKKTSQPGMAEDSLLIRRLEKSLAGSIPARPPCLNF